MFAFVQSTNSEIVSKRAFKHEHLQDSFHAAIGLHATVTCSPKIIGVQRQRAL